jgi:uncharacterized membrane protein (TIGR02234 family)
VSGPVTDDPSALGDEGAARRRLPRSAIAAVLGIAGGAVVVLVSSSPTWLRVSLRASAGEVRLTGRNAAAAAVPLALVAAAGLVALALVRSWLRRLIAVLIAAAGAGVLAVAVRVVADPLAVARRSSKVTSAGAPASAHLTTASYICALGALLIIAGAALATLCGARWPAPTRRYERADTGTRRPSDTWDALERGEDPTNG